MLLYPITGEAVPPALSPLPTTFRRGTGKWGSDLLTTLLPYPLPPLGGGREEGGEGAISPVVNHPSLDFARD